MYLNEATLLNNIRVRYSKDKIYVSGRDDFLLDFCPFSSSSCKCVLGHAANVSVGA